MDYFTYEKMKDKQKKIETDDETLIAARDVAMDENFAIADRDIDGVLNENELENWYLLM